MSVQRYDIDVDNGVIVETTQRHGDWVKFEDYEEEVESLKEEIEQLRDRIKRAISELE